MFESMLDSGKVQHYSLVDRQALFQNLEISYFFIKGFRDFDLLDCDLVTLSER